MFFCWDAGETRPTFFEKKVGKETSPKKRFKM